MGDYNVMNLINSLNKVGKIDTVSSLVNVSIATSHGTVTCPVYKVTVAELQNKIPPATLGSNYSGFATVIDQNTQEEGAFIIVKANPSVLPVAGMSANEVWLAKWNPADLDGEYTSEHAAKYTLTEPVANGFISFEAIVGQDPSLTYNIVPLSATDGCVTASKVNHRSINYASDIARLANNIFPTKISNTDPTASDDISLGYKTGMAWINTVNNYLYYCANSEVGSVSWFLVNPPISRISPQFLITEITSDYTATVNDRYINCDCTAGDIIVNITTATQLSGLRIGITKTDNSTNFVTINALAGAKVAGKDYVRLYAQYQSFTIVCTGTEWVIEGGLPNRQLIETINGTGQADIRFIKGIDESFLDYEIDMSYIRSSSDADVIRMQMSSDGGVTFKSGASDYFYDLYYFVTGTAFTRIGGAPASFILLAGSNLSPNDQGNEVFEGASGKISFRHLSSAVTTKMINADIMWDASNSNFNRAETTGATTGTAVINGLRVYFVLGTFAGGTISLYGIR